LVHHARLAHDIGMPEDRVAICQDGDAVLLGDHGVSIERQCTPAGFLYVDGIVGDVGRGVLRDRGVLLGGGVVGVGVSVDGGTGAVLKGPEIVTRGWVYGPEA